MARRTKEELKQIIADAKKRKEQLEHQMNRVERKMEYMEKKPWQIKRDARTHRVASKGGIFEHFFPATREFDEKEFYQLMEYIFDYPGMKEAVSGQIERVRKKREDNVYSLYPAGDNTETEGRS